MSDEFWSKVVIKDKDSCWEWQGTLNIQGYGSCYANIDGKGRTHNAHKVAWVLTNGYIPLGKICLHKCDNRSCVNPNHLYIGTYSDNICDAITRSGARFGRVSKFTQQDIDHIKCLSSKGVDKKHISTMYNVSLTYVYMILRGDRGINLQ